MLFHHADNLKRKSNARPTQSKHWPSFSSHLALAVPLTHSLQGSQRSPTGICSPCLSSAGLSQFALSYSPLLKKSPFFKKRQQTKAKELEEERAKQRKADHYK